MNFIRQILIIILGLFIFSCVNRPVVKKYTTIVVYDDKKQYRHNLKVKFINSDTLYLFFEHFFNSDTIDISLNGKLNQTLILNTNSSTGVAKQVKLGEIYSINKIEISKNNGLPLTIKLNQKSMNIWGIKYYNDTLEARYLKHVPTYD